MEDPGDSRPSAANLIDKYQSLTSRRNAGMAQPTQELPGLELKLLANSNGGTKSRNTV